MTIICPHCGNEIDITRLYHGEENLEGFYVTCTECKRNFDVDFDMRETFITDIPKMADFKILLKEEFLLSYSYLTEEEYDATALYYSWLTEPELEQERPFTYDDGFEDCNVVGKDECLDILTQMLNSGKYDCDTIQAAIEAIENN